jgi:predicted GNAT family acetyltransferase
MTEPAAAITVRDNRPAHRYEIAIGGVVGGELSYELHATTAVLLRTGVEPSFEHPCIATELIRAALDDLRMRGLTAIAVCPLVGFFVAQHPDYASLVNPGQELT